MAESNTERTLRHYAKQLAGEAYDRIRQDSYQRRENRRMKNIDPEFFMRTYPTIKDFMLGRQHMPDGSIRWDVPSWLHYMALARVHMTNMLGRADVHDNIKAGLYDALIEDREKQFQHEARGTRQPNIYQRPNMRFDS